jgi:flagellar biosynthesis protein FlhF
MRLKLYRAVSMAEAMARVRADLGEEALILGTRRVGDGVEVTAALDPDQGQSSGAPSLPPPDPARLTLLQFHAIPAALHAQLCRGPLPEALAQTLVFAPLPIGPNARPLLLTGPPGGGKTLTIARLATRLVMAGTLPLVVTADGKRAGAAEQLAAFTRLLGITLIVANHPVTVARALTRRQNGAPVLLDSAGVDAFDRGQIEEIRALAGAAEAVVALVLPAGLDPAEAADLARAFADTGASLLIATKLDLARRYGGLFAAAAAARLPFTEAGIGPNAADGLLPLTPAILAERMMHTGNPSHERRAA